MLILTRKRGESIVFTFQGQQIQMVVLDFQGGRVKLGFEESNGSSMILVERQEIYLQRIARESEGAEE